MPLIAFSGLTHPVAFHDGTEQLLDTLDGWLTGWRWRPLAAAEIADAAEPRLVLRRVGPGTRIEAPWLDTPVLEDSPFHLTANLAVDLLEAYLAEHPARLSVHCAAAVFAGRLVLFPSRSRAGKSTLAARLAAAGVPLLSDDVLPLGAADGSPAADTHGVSLGAAPRLRLPLPASASTPFRDFVRRHAGPGDGRYLYLALPASTRPSLGTAVPLGAVVLLDRTAKATGAEIRPAGRADGLQELITQNLSPAVGMGEAVGRMHRVIAGLPCFSLRYHDLDQAVAALARQFDTWPETMPAAGDPRRVAELATATRPAPPPADGPRYRQHPAVALHRIEDGLFLVDPSGGGVYRLNPVAAGLWRLLAEPTAQIEATAILHGAFPDCEKSQIAADVGTLFAELAARNLIRVDGESFPERLAATRSA